MKMYQCDFDRLYQILTLVRQLLKTKKHWIGVSSQYKSLQQSISTTLQRIEPKTFNLALECLTSRPVSRLII